MATVKALLRNKLAPGAAFGGDLTDGQLLSPCALTWRHLCPTSTTMARAIRLASTPGEGHPSPGTPTPLVQAAAEIVEVGQASCSS